MLRAGGLAAGIVPAAIEDVWREYLADPSRVDLRNRLVEQYLGLVKYQAAKIHARLPAGVDVDDLTSAGVFGLVDAIRAYDPSRGVRFESFSTLRIRGAMFDELRHGDWVPRLVRRRAALLQAAERDVREATGRPPTVDELAAKLQIDPRDVERLQSEANVTAVTSLSKKWFETDSLKDVRQVDILEDRRVERPTQRLEQLDAMRTVTKSLNRSERLLMILYYFESLTMKEIGATLDLSESRVSQMHSRIIAGLRGRSAAKHELVPERS